jgi:succinate dehydrogenase / fumarate reductase cytochrome b subunit
MQSQPPVFLNLLQIRLPVMGVASIVHRATGLLMVLLIPLLLLGLQTSLSPDGYARLSAWFGGLAPRLALAVAIWALAYHFLAGLRFLLIDLHIGVGKEAGRRGAWAVHLGAAILGGLALLGTILR